jgi:hypothetical protein
MRLWSTVHLRFVLPLIDMQYHDFWLTASLQILHQADFTIPVEIEGNYHNVYVIKRPGVDEFMKRVGELYEVVVFTASVSKVSCSFFLNLWRKENGLTRACAKIVWRSSPRSIRYTRRCSSSSVPRKLLQPPRKLRQRSLTSWPRFEGYNHHRQLTYLIHFPPPACCPHQQLVF